MNVSFESILFSNLIYSYKWVGYYFDFVSLLNILASDFNAAAIYISDLRYFIFMDSYGDRVDSFDLICVGNV